MIYTDSNEDLINIGDKVRLVIKGTTHTAIGRVIKLTESNDAHVKLYKPFNSEEVYRCYLLTKIKTKLR